MPDLGGALTTRIWAELANDVGLCALLVMLYVQLRRRVRDRRPALLDALIGMLFATAALVTMASTVALAPGVLLDGRHVALLLAGLFGGPLASLITFAFAALYRLRLGGVGVVPGLAAMAASAALGALSSAALRRARRPLALHHLLLLGLASSAAELLGLLLLPGADLALEAVQIAGPPLVAATVLGTLLLGSLLIEERRHFDVEKRLLGLTTNLPGVVYQREIAPDGRVRYPFVSDRVRDFCDLDPAAVMADPDRLLERVHPDDRQRVRRSIAEATQRRGFWCDEYRVLGPGGRVAWMRAVGAPRPRDGGGGTVWDALMMEITELKEAEGALRRLNETLEQRVAERGAALRASETALFEARKLEALGQAVGTVAHDFNNLLTAVIGNVELARPRATDERLRALLGDALSAAERGEQMVRDLLAFASRRPLDLAAVDVDETLRDIEPILRRLAGPDNELRLDLAAGLAPALTHREELERALLNLVTNARDAIEGGGAITIETRGDAAPPPGRRTVRITVRDTGRGMSPEVRARAFDPFFTTKQRGAGTGLGLSQVYGFVRRCGGGVVLDSAEGTGTAVTLWLRAAAD